MATKYGTTKITNAKTTRQPVNIIQQCCFTALPGVPKLLHVNDVLFLMPIFRLDEVQCIYVDATGEFDLCMSLDGLTYKFTTCRDVPTKYCYRFMSVGWLAKRLGVGC